MCHGRWAGNPAGAQWRRHVALERRKPAGAGLQFGRNCICEKGNIDQKHGFCKPGYWAMAELCLQATADVGWRSSMTITSRFQWPSISQDASRRVVSSIDKGRWLRRCSDALRSGLVGYRVYRVAAAIEGHHGPRGCFPSLQTIANTAECSRRYVMIAIKRLEHLNLVARAPHETYRSNEYRLLLPPTALPRLRPRFKPIRFRSSLPPEQLSSGRFLESSLIPLSGEQSSLLRETPFRRVPTAAEQQARVNALLLAAALKRTEGRPFSAYR